MFVPQFFRLVILSGVLFSGIATAEEFRGHKLTMKNGRILEGIYNAETGKLEIIGETGSRVALIVKSEDIAKVEEVVLNIKVITKAEQELKIRKLERAGVILALKNTSDQLAKKTVTPASTIESYQKRIPEVEGLLKVTTAKTAEVRKVYDDYRRQVVLKESTTTTTTVTDTQARVDVDTTGNAQGYGTYGDAWWAQYRERSTALGNKREVATVTKEITADAARSELAKLEAEVKSLDDDVRQMNAYITYLNAEITLITKLSQEKSQYEERLLQLDRTINGEPKVKNK